MKGRWRGWVRGALWAAALSGPACEPSEEASSPLDAGLPPPLDAVSPPPPPPANDCRSARPGPYPLTSYAGVHAGPGNDDRVRCTLAAAFRPGWHALRGHGVAQPNTFSPDGTRTYVTTSAPAPGACTVHALDVATGELAWCRAVPGALRSAVEVDDRGRLYVTGAEDIRSLTADGVERWRTPVDGAIGAHFTPAGRLAAVTEGGTVLLLDRLDGATVARLSLPEAFGHVPLAGPPAGVDLGAAMPPTVAADFARIFGEDMPLGAFIGSDGFSSNTLGVAPDGGALYVVGGGADPQHGALMQILVVGDALRPGWSMALDGGSASSPALSPDGVWLKVSDGNTVAHFLRPSAEVARAHLVDLAACARNADADPAPERCAPAAAVPLLSGPALGASPIFEDALHYLWEVQFGALFDSSVPDLRALRGDEVLWSAHLPDGAVWSSVLTVTDDALVGTMTRLTPSQVALLGVILPETAQSELVVVSRADGAVRFRAPVADDSTSTVTVGPDGALYVTLLGMLSGLATDTQIVGGVMRFEPVE